MTSDRASAKKPEAAGRELRRTIGMAIYVYGAMAFALTLSIAAARGDWFAFAGWFVASALFIAMIARTPL